MAEALNTPGDLSHPILNLTPEEKRVFSQLFARADTEKIGVVTGETAVKFFEPTKLPAPVLGEIWQIADTENRGLLTSSGFCIVLRLIGHYQAGRDPSPELAFRPGPLPKFEGLNIPSGTPAPPLPGPIQPQLSGSGPIRVPPLTPDKVAEYAALFENSGAQSGLLSGEMAKNIFEKARLSNDTLGRIWNLADTQLRGALDMTEFIIAMHLIASYKSGALKALPSNLPPGLYEAASRKAPAPGLRLSGGARSGEPAAIPRQFSGQGPQRTASPLSRPPYSNSPQSPQPTGGDWAITPQEKAAYDQLFSQLDTAGKGYITGEQAVPFFSNSRLPEDVLASIWDLADINSEGRLSRDEFAVAMYLIKQQKPKPGQPRLNLPTSLPPNLIPPSMRNQPRPAQSPAASAFDNAAFAPQKPASEDLFGLDAFSSPLPAPIPAQSTGGSVPYSKPAETDPFGNKVAPPTSPQGTAAPAPRSPASMFKPFQPSSSFGQGLTAQTTGASAASSQPQARGPQPSAMDDLIGDVDPEVSKKLTQETTELANMSNQIGTLRNQMQDVQHKKSATESDLASANNQKRELEQRLAQFRSQYEQEVKQVKALEEQLATSRNDTRKLHQELAMVEGTYQDLQNQHRQVSGALEADQRENASLKERIRKMNSEISQLRPQLDKMRSDARQQKGMVAINKKQLATNEAERDRMTSEITELARAQQQQQQREQQERASAVASPVASERSSTNPFFRKSPAPAGESAMSPSGFNHENSQRDFDNIFGPSVASPQSSAPPQTSFRNESQTTGLSTQSGPSAPSSGPDVPTPSTSPPASCHQESSRNVEPPAPPESRVFSSPFLPIREGAPRSDSIGSSVKVSAPASRYGGAAAGTETPSNVEASPAPAPVQEREARGSDKPEASRSDTGSFGSSSFNRNQTSSPAASATSDAARSGSRVEEPKEAYQPFGPPPTEKDIPGAFPTESSTPMQPTPTGGSAMSDRSKGSTRPSEGFSSTRTDPFSSMNGSQSRGPSSAKHDFDAAFAGFGSRSGQERQNTGSSVNGSVDNAAASKFSKEFPPIEDLDHDEGSDTNSEPGFDDNFTPASPKPETESESTQSQPQQPRLPTGAPTSNERPEDAFRGRPTVTQAESSASLPSADAQKPPPSYEQTMSPPGSSPQPRGSNQFPPEFGGLLPSREDPTSPTHASQSPEKSFSSSSPTQSQNPFGGSSFSRGVPSESSNAFSSSPFAIEKPASTVLSDTYQYQRPWLTTGQTQPPTTQQPQTTRPSYQDDFDTGFDDLDEAREADDKADDDFSSSYHREGFDDFNPVFDSPATSKSTMASQQIPIGTTAHDDFSDFEQHLGGYGSSSSKAPQQQPHTTTTQDWDAIFSGLDTPQENKISSGPSKSPFPDPAGMGDSGMGGGESSSAAQNRQNEMPQLGRALSAGSEHDDPILKKLTGMGYPRQDALNALEKFDYDINKAADYLTSGH